jgi:hypothetical protein
MRAAGATRIEAVQSCQGVILSEPTGSVRMTRRLTALFVVQHSITPGCLRLPCASPCVQA